MILATDSETGLIVATSNKEFFRPLEGSLRCALEFLVAVLTRCTRATC